ncbi:MAG: hypothetical protein A2552_08325 [Sulfuricurvum sp. RIFOXYD2_FULL_44_160]|uniref:Uncharacterized protein n=1 Tax=Sulfuricurvum kujiense TaxID=148813 RepID=A0A2D3WJJ0_9BACT|nr:MULTISPECIES: hypothetical protein [Sulfuricurvum]OHD91008.1 MAG: hypothetical protein A2517_01715 [Sulfuricurvum sp. RIFOXYD12_FULL_44_77]OHD91417.1 MAG: hypothetical protein A2552_08325 [Sulfuricurvum sp. RIFOXYD2_FULL_44_160]DAB37884.1 MAG TPA: hypothetical protein CFH83_08840 [Sulfuricurvum kujiense]
MPLWIMPVYIVSGITLLVSGYFSYTNKPFCFQNQAIRNESIRLHRLKLRQFDLGAKEQLTPQEEAEYTIYKRADKKAFFIDQILSISVPIFLITFLILIVSSNWALQMPLYIVSAFLILIGKNDAVTNASGFRKPLCVSNQSFYELDIIESFYKRINGLSLDEEEKRNIDNYETEIRWYGWQMNVLYVGIALHLLATILHGIIHVFQS